MTSTAETNVRQPMDELIAQLGDHNGVKRHEARVAIVAAGEMMVPGLVSALRSDNPDARWEAAKALTEVRDSRAIPALVESLVDEVPGVRWLAAEALSQAGRPVLEPLLHGLIQHSESPWFRDGAHHILRHIGRGDMRVYVQPVLRALEGIEPTIAVMTPAAELLDSLERAKAGR